MMSTRTLGVDVGGTSISFIDMYSPDRIISERCISTPKDVGNIINAIIENVQQMIDVKSIDKPLNLGIAIAGQVDQKKKSIILTPNLPFSKDYPIGSILEDSLKLKVLVDNDANSAAIGEKVYGRAVDMEDFISVTLGTGIGSGIFVRGQILHGKTGAGGEAGHIKVDSNGLLCACGGEGCLELYASGLAIARLSKMRTGVEKNAKEICESAIAGNKTSKEILNEAGEWLGRGLITLVNLFNPEAIFFSGSLAKAPEDYFAPAFKIVKERSFGTLGKELKLEVSPLADKIGVIGAAAIGHGHKL